MAIDFESLKDSVIAAVQTGATKAKELAGTGAAKAKELANTGAAKAKELTEISKLKVQNSVEQDAIRKAYAELGKQYYAVHGADPDPALADLCQKITDSMGKVSYNNERIADMKAAGGPDLEDMAAEAKEKVGDAVETAEAVVEEKVEEMKEALHNIPEDPFANIGEDKKDE